MVPTALPRSHSGQYKMQGVDGQSVCNKEGKKEDTVRKKDAVPTDYTKIGNDPQKASQYVTSNILIWGAVNNYN